MGSHYTRKEACPTCGSYEYDCRCIVPKVKEPTRWMVDPKTFNVITVSQFDKKCSEDGASGFLIRNSNKYKDFAEKKEAEQYSTEIIFKEIYVLTERLDLLRQELNKKLS